MVQANLGFLARKLLGRPTCKLAPAAVLGWKARILNARASSEHIRVGANSFIGGELFVFAHGGDIEIGSDCYIYEGARIWSGGAIKIGNGVVIGPDVSIFDNHTHPLSATARHAQIRSIFTVGHPKEIELAERPVKIGDGAQIGAGSIILRGVEIGNNVVVPHGSVVTKSIAP
ncbi:MULTISPECIES: DapH/DapD/GlmU-related protein [unclassified Bradyrhizobium]|uniref:acyltransferase n=1 Tax=unclassified Bradyrhizobium TaxID=2631580 RepID=UPI001BA53501|nr:MULTISPECIES: acyltransferase [unclassified Bradyrhizobium]MBR1206624.1 acyltransferase [Bradyrhizobium sp. AUGA SZCCT0124]MBR1315398.1 acyltransferase [Bradyrhizobium sp. AUGA SZCCT0051]MBR1338540.1 acyltransferase [Bradyrhizobium sp. AUGA SZCCT0105]MBR1356195.1 acyltransferase [Bradyrhizobium sp. AUGA SZCCT0045]